MHLTDTEYQIFKTRFHCTAVADEEYRVPIEVEAPGGGSSWTAFISGAQFHEGVSWISVHCGALGAPVPGDRIAATEAPVTAPVVVKTVDRVHEGMAGRRLAALKRAAGLDPTTVLLLAMLVAGGVYLYSQRFEAANSALPHKADTMNAPAPSAGALPSQNR